MGAGIEVLARAFRDNPLNRAVIGSDPGRRLRANRHGMRAQIPVAVRHGWVRAARLEGRVAGVLVAVPPHGGLLPLPPWPARIRCLLGQGARVAGRWADVAEQLRSQRPLLAHWYLATLGVEPDLQRRGVGRALLRAWLAEVDRDPVRAYLETDEAENRAFYAREGFEPGAEVRVLATPVWLLERPPRP